MSTKKEKKNVEVHFDRGPQKKNRDENHKKPVLPEHFNEAAQALALRATVNPAARARLLAEKLLSTADLLEKQDEAISNKVGPELRAALLNSTSQQIFKAWLAFHGLDEKRHERLTLIEAIKTASTILGQLDDVLPRGDVDDGRIAVVADLARTFYALNFPMRAAKIDDSLLVNAILAWPNEAGRPKPGEIGKWAAINILAKAAGLPAAAPRTIQREWLRHAHELELGNPWGEKPPIPKR